MDQMRGWMNCWLYELLRMDWAEVELMALGENGKKWGERAREIMEPQGQKT